MRDKTACRNAGGDWNPTVALYMAGRRLRNFAELSQRDVYIPLAIKEKKNEDLDSCLYCYFTVSLEAIQEDQKTSGKI